MKINGLLWEQIPDCDICCLLGANSAFWTPNELLKLDFPVSLAKIGKSVNSKKIEAFGQLSDGDKFNLAWAGFGSVVDEKGSKTGDCSEAKCGEYVKSISGGVAGYIPATQSKGCFDCEPIEYDGCCDCVWTDLTTSEITAAYGTIKISYDAATAKKVAVAGDPNDFTQFTKVPAAALYEIDDDGEKVPVNPEDYIGEVTIEE